MPTTDVSQKSFDQLARDLGADDLDVRERATRELIRRSLSQTSVLEKAVAERLRTRDAEVDARLNEVIHACRYYITVIGTVADPLGRNWNDRKVEFKFGTSASDIAVTTPPREMEAGRVVPMGATIQSPPDPHDPAKKRFTGMQIYNSAQAGKVIFCGAAVDHSIYMEAISYGDREERFRIHCNGRADLRQALFTARYGLFNRVQFAVIYWVQTVCGPEPPLPPPAPPW